MYVGLGQIPRYIIKFWYFGNMLVKIHTYHRLTDGHTYGRLDEDGHSDIRTYPNCVLIKNLGQNFFLSKYPEVDA